MREEGEQIGRFKVRSLMREPALVSKQPGSHAYKKATVERPDIPNILNRAFDVEAPNQVWCGDITYVGAQGKWHYLAVVMDLYARRVVGWALSEKPDADLGTVRNKASQTPHAASQRDHRCITFCKLVEARHHPAILFQPAEHALDDVALSVLWPIEQPGQAWLGLAFHRTHRNNGLHAATVAVLTQGLCVIAFIG